MNNASCDFKSSLYLWQELANIRAVKGGTAPDACNDYGVRIYYGFSGPASEKYKFRISGEPKTGSNLPYSVFTRRKKERFDFDGENGNTVYFCLRYENSKGEVGPHGAAGSGADAATKVLPAHAVTYTN